MNDKDNSGPAFPSVFINDGDCNTTSQDGQIVAPGFKVQMHGMTLRDYFAAKAMQAALPICGEDTREEGVSYCQHVAAVAYEMADAMLKARSE